MAKKLKTENHKKKEKWNILQKGSDDFEKSLFSGPRIELFSDTEMILEGCMGIFEYNDNYLKLKLSSGALILQGAEFDITFFEDKTIRVKGKILSLEFCV